MKIIYRLIISCSFCAFATFIQPILAGEIVKPMIIGEKIPFNKTLTTQTSTPQTLTIEHPGARFIKVHFNQFSLKGKGYVKIQSAISNEHIIYRAEQQGPLFAQSIHGDQIIIEWSSGDPSHESALSIDYYTIGVKDPARLRSLNDDDDDEGSISTCGLNERRDVACWLDQHSDKVSWSQSIAILLLNGRSICTAWRVGPENRMMTNNHCVKDPQKVKNMEIWFNFQRKNCGGAMDTAVKVMGDQLLKTDFNLDYTLFTVKDFDKIESFGYFGLDTQDPGLGEPIYIPQHGAGNPKELAIESDVNRSGICQIDLTSATGNIPGSDVGYFCDTIGGSSGSPVVSSASHKVVALHHFGGCENQGVKISKIWPQISDYFADGLPEGKVGDSSRIPTEPTYISVEEGEVVNDIHLHYLEYKTYRLPASARTANLIVRTFAGTGDVDLYVRSGQQPTPEMYDCRPFQGGNNERCEIPYKSEDLYIMLKGFHETQGLTLAIEPKTP